MLASKLGSQSSVHFASVNFSFNGAHGGRGPKPYALNPGPIDCPLGGE